LCVAQDSLLRVPFIPKDAYLVHWGWLHLLVTLKLTIPTLLCALQKSNLLLPSTPKLARVLQPSSRQTCKSRNASARRQKGGVERCEKTSSVNDGALSVEFSRANRWMKLPPPSGCAHWPLAACRATDRTPQPTKNTQQHRPILKRPVTTF